MILILQFLFILYYFAIIALIIGFDKVHSFDELTLKPNTKFTIIVPFRDEAENLPKLLSSFSSLNYPSNLFEVILVDDDSAEEFSSQFSEFSVQIIKNIRVSNSPKKDAILTAIKTLKTQWIITTDADCVVPENWLLSLDICIQKHQIEMIVGAVKYDCENNFLHHFQQLDLASLQGATIGSFGLKKGFMCNGANFAYAKSFFETLNGFEGNDKIASGDDVFLLQKAIAKFPEKVFYLKSKNNIVTTKPTDTWQLLWNQRLRWASKTASYQSNFGKVLGLIVLFGNVGCWLLVVGCWFANSKIFACLLLFAKFLVDFTLIYKTNIFLKSKTRFVVLSSLLYPFFSVLVALWSMVGKYEWKGRKFKD